MVMGHRLKPHEGMSYLAPAEVADRLRECFAYVDVDGEAGAEHVGDMIVQFLRMKQGYQRWKQPPPEAAEIDQVIARLEAVRNESVQVAITEDPADDDTSLSFAVVPGEDIIIGYANARHERIATPLVMRAAEALNYQVELL
jgi:hypothetical protein